jgi:hypothetical protein
MPIPRGLDHAERKRFEQVLQALRRQEGYTFTTKNPQQFTALFGIDPEAAKTAGVEPKPHQLMLVLYLQDEPIDVWSLRGKITRMPPIVILSACDTHAADRNHATVANGFVALGARAVLASVFPLFARTAATFAARLIYRLADFLVPAIRLFDRALTWNEVVSGMIRMHLLTDFLRRLELGNRIAKETDFSIHLAGNKAINGGVADPFGIVVDALVDAGLERATALRELEFATANSSAISYLHMGRPETILIDDIDRAKEQLALYQADA